ncbi:hypothetical protein HU200_054456 [Digitaria exilis]|uniref:F-box domain-containing protein n=1 Tax=Digitaria exilis TaxID=1010633 RepID=A0A835E6Z3_9POAL|nr:hypothetical protein HU200_054456 [Digitaria exilis]
MGLSSSKQRRPPPPSPDVPPPRWSEIPPDLIGLILSRLLYHGDRLNLRAVCRQWRLAVRQQNPHTLEWSLPWIRLRTTTDGDGFTFQSLPDGKLHRFRAANVLDPSRPALLRSSGDDGWLELFNPGDTYYMCNTCSGAIIRLPRVPARHCVKSAEVGGGGGGGETIPSWSIIRKVMVCSPGLIAAILYSNAVGLYRPGDTSWSVYPAPECNDIAFYRGKLYSVTDDESLFAHELVNGSDETVSHHVVEQVIKARNNHDERRRHFPRVLYLVASRDKLLMVVKWIVPRRAVSRSIRKNTAEGDGAIRLKVFEADLEMGRWMEVKNGLDGHAIFASRSCSKLVRLSGHDQRFQGDRVYFPGCESPIYRTTVYTGDDSPSCRFYDMRKNTITKVFLNKGDAKYQQSYPEWFFPSPQKLCM